MIICAALKVKANTNHDTIVPCWRHGKGYEILHELCPDRRLHIKAEEGFIDHNGNFLNRVEAYKEAIKCGQLPKSVQWYKTDHQEVELYSEDLY